MFKLFIGRTYSIQCLIFLLILILSSHLCSVNSQKMYKNQTASIVGFFPIHSKGNSSNTCGKLNIERGIHRLEAMLFAIDKINKNENLLPNLVIQPNLHDTCNQVSRALDGALEIVTLNNQKAKCDPNRPPVVGVIGPSSSSVSLEVANLLRLFQIPQISYAASSPLLNDRTKYKYFLRTVPSDSEVVKVVLAVAKFFGWSSVSVLYSEGIYGESLFETFQKLAEAENLCIVEQIKVSDESNYTIILEKLRQQTYTKAVILFCNDDHMLNVLSNASAANTVDYSWVSLDFWVTNKKFLDTSKVQNAANSVIIVRQSVSESQEFKKYFNSLNLSNNKRNPWFIEYWEESFNCSSKLETCNKTGELSNKVFDSKISYVIDAVYALAHALDSLLSRLDKLNKDPNSFNGSMILNELMTKPYNGSFGLKKFNDMGYMNNGYDIIQIQNDHYVKIGSWFNETLSINETLVRKPSKSYCSEPCAPQYAKKVLGNGPSCCFQCEICDENQIVKNGTCEKCPYGYAPSSNFNSCVQLPIVYISRSWVITMSIIASIGVVATVGVSLLFIYYSWTDVVIASSPMLSFPLLFGVFLCYILTFFMIADQTIVFCNLQRFGMSFSFCICYGSLLIKVSRFVRVFNKNKVSKRGSLLPAASTQSILLLCIVLVQMVISFIGYVLNKDVELKKTFIKEKVGMMILCSIPTFDLIASLAYNFVLITVCTIYAFRTRKVPLGFNEAKYIGFIMYASILLWLCFIPAYIIGDDEEVHVIALSMNIPLHATSILTGIFGPKIYILFTKSLQNKRTLSTQSFSSYSFVDNGNTSQRCSSSAFDQISRVTSTTQLSLEESFCKK